MKATQLVKTLTSILLLVSSLPIHAAWFEATGQAVIHDGEKGAARQKATQEAIKQALLFAGASVKSLQRMTNGLLEDDRFEIRTSGEVSSIELIDEIYHSDYVTVSIRADIFPQKAMCQASDYKKNIVTTWYNINKRQQAAAGNMYDFGQTLANKLQQESKDKAQFSHIRKVEPYYLSPKVHEGKSLAFDLARKTNSQFVLFGEILELGLETYKNKGLAFWKSDSTSRNLILSLKMYDGHSGEMVMQEQQSISALWEFNLHKPVNTQSNMFWESIFGQATQELIQNLIYKIDDTISCLPAYGRVINIGGEQLNINIGKENGVREGDMLTLFQVNQFHDAQNQLHRQFQLHPEKVMVKQVFAETSIVTSAEGRPLSNIQPNDFVARR